MNLECERLTGRSAPDLEERHWRQLSGGAVAACVSKQAEQMLIIAAATNDDEMRDELLGFAERLTIHSSEIEAANDRFMLGIEEGSLTRRVLHR
jgi:hypothetical protein